MKTLSLLLLVLGACSTSLLLAGVLVSLAGLCAWWAGLFEV